MKNIHLIATDKPTGIFQSNSGLQFSIRDKVRVEPLKGFHTYITSDEEITGFEHNIWVIKGERILLWQNTMALVSNNKPRKIILTTDQDLIKDGVQAIDDEFLDWFVKNPSCESVETYSLGIENSDTGESGHYKYEIIIQQEEQIKCYCGHTSYCDCEPQEETKQDQVERMYSEEEMLEFSEWVSHNDWVYLPSKGYWVNEEQEELEENFTTKELFEQFKKEIKE